MLGVPLKYSCSTASSVLLHKSANLICAKKMSQSCALCRNYNSIHATWELWQKNTYADASFAFLHITNCPELKEKRELQRWSTAILNAWSFLMSETVLYSVQVWARYSDYSTFSPDDEMNCIFQSGSLQSRHFFFNENLWLREDWGVYLNNPPALLQHDCQSVDALH